MPNPEHPTVLVVDDDVDCAQSLSDLLVELGCHVLVRHDGRSALEAAVALRPALMVVDLALNTQVQQWPPGAAGGHWDDGCRLMNAVRDRLPPGDRPVMVCLTGHADPRTELDCLQQGFDLFLAKPLILEALHEVLAVAASRSRWQPPTTPGARPQPVPPPG